MARRLAIPKGETKACNGKACSARILHARNVETGAHVPLDARAHPVYRVWQSVESGEWLCVQERTGGVHVQPGTAREVPTFVRVTHFATCPNAEQFSGGRKG